MATTPAGVSRRAFLMPGGERYHYVASAVVVVMPERVDAVARAIARIAGAEIRARENHRIIVVLEGPSGDELADRLRRIGDLDGVIAANLVFQHIEELREQRE